MDYTVNVLNWFNERPQKLAAARRHLAMAVASGIDIERDMPVYGSLTIGEHWAFGDIDWHIVAETLLPGCTVPVDKRDTEELRPATEMRWKLSDRVKP